MRVRLRTTYASPAGAHAAGSVVDLEKAEAYDLIERGYAAQIEAETATEAVPQRAVAPAQRRPR